MRASSATPPSPATAAPRFDQSRLSDEDQANIQVLREYEQALTGGATNEAMREFLLRNKARVFEVLQQ